MANQRDRRVEDYNTQVGLMVKWVQEHLDDPNLIITDYHIYYICSSLEEAVALPRTTPTIAHTESTLIEYDDGSTQIVDILAYLGTIPEDKRDGIENNAKIWGQ